MPKITCGLEIHQQLKTKKLFCECDGNMQDGTAEYTVERKLRPVVGETGEIDVAAAHEAGKKKSYLYEAFDDSACLVDLDEEPPRSLRNEALDAALILSKLCDAKLVDEVQVMRKTVVDGSNTTGFQRTALVAYDGSIESSEGKISIPTIIVEEDSARQMSSTDEQTVYRLDRLGIPLIEISTGPDIKSPRQCMEVAEKIGLLLRSTGFARRGLGTIRQDVNVSIEGGARVEIKGAQDLKLIPTLVELEAQRQERLLELKVELAKRKITKVVSEITNVSHLLKNSKSKVIMSTLSNGGVVLGVCLAGFKGLLGKELQPNRRLGSEFSDCAKVAAGVGGIFHSDELPNYGILPDEVEMIHKHMKGGTNDAFAIVCAQRERAEHALAAVLARANEALKGVPSEVRAANPDGTTRFMRPMPGAARLYPETDVPPLRITKERIRQIVLPETIEARAARYQKLGLSKDLAELAARSESAKFIDECMMKFKKLKPAYVVELIMTSPRTVKRQFNVDIDPSDDDFIVLLEALSEEEIAKESVLDILKENKPVCEVIKKYRLLSDKEVKKILEEIVKENKGQQFNVLIGKAMAKLRGKASGEKVAALLKKLNSA